MTGLNMGWRIPSLLLFSACAVLAPAQLSPAIKQGENNLAGEVASRKYVDFPIPVGAGQTLSVQVSSTNKGVHFTILSPGRLESLYASIVSGTEMKARRIPLEGIYLVRVYQRADKGGDGKPSRFLARVRIDGAAFKPRPGGNPWHRTGEAQAKVPLLTGVQRAAVRMISYGSEGATLEFQTRLSLRRVLIKDGKVMAHDSREPGLVTRRGAEMVVSFGRGPVEEYTLPSSFLAKP